MDFINIIKSGSNLFYFIVDVSATVAFGEMIFSARCRCCGEKCYGFAYFLVMESQCWNRRAPCVAYTVLLVKVKDGHTPKERRRDAHLPFIGCWARRWIYRYCLWRIASATPDLRLFSQPELVFISANHRGMARLSWRRWLVTYWDSLPAWRRSPIQALTA